MIIADTNVIIDFWRQPTDQVAEVFAREQIATCGVIQTELLRGSQSETDFERIQLALADFIYLDFAQDDWPSLARLLIQLKQHGVMVPFQDAMIACLALKYRCSIWTHDKHFLLIQQVVPDLRLFSNAN